MRLCILVMASVCVLSTALPKRVAADTTCAEDRPVWEQLACAQSLAWTGHPREALAHYDRLLPLADASNRRAIMLARLQALEALGETDAALEGYEQLAAQDPDDVDARVGIARVQRQQGRVLQARRYLFDLAHQGVTQESLCQELAWNYIAAGQPARARSWSTCSGETAADALAVRVEELQRTELSAATTVMDDSFGMLRVAPRGIARFSLGHDLVLSVGAGLTYAVLDVEELMYDVAGTALSYSIGRFDFRIAAGGMFQAEAPHVLGDFSGTVAMQVLDILRMRVKARHRPFLETAPLLATPEEAFYGAGIAGAMRLGHVTHLQVRQAELGIDFSPLPGAFVYATGTHLQISDDNHGNVLAAGVGWNVLTTLLEPGFPLDVVLKWNTYMAGYSVDPPDYFSPDFFEIHDVGGELRWRVFDGFEAFGAGAVTFQATQPTGLGHLFSFGARWQNDWMKVALRGMARDDLVYQQRRLMLSFGAKL